MLCSAPAVITVGPKPEVLPRLGQISFINSLPVLIPIEAGHVNLSAQIVYASPTKLNCAYARGLLDLGAMSSFFFLDNNAMELIPDLSISSDGPVGSVLFFSKVEPRNLNRARIAVPAASATSVNLLHILLREQFNVRPEFVVDENPNLDDDSIMAALLIGDRALIVDSDWSRRLWRADLGFWWRRQTGLPMVFGVWAARASWASANQESLRQVTKALHNSTALGLSSLFPLVAAEAAARTGLPLQRMQRYYFEELNFKLTDRHMQALDLFRSLCLRYGLLRPQHSNQASCFAPTFSSTEAASFEPAI